MIVRDGLYYAAGLGAGGALAWWLAGLWGAVPLFLLAGFCLYFFRDPERIIPSGAVAVSPADGLVVAVKAENLPSQPDAAQAAAAAQNRISIFLSVFDVHVNRAPIAGVITDVVYRKGSFRIATQERCSLENEQNIVTIQGENGVRVTFKQIAGFLARRIVFNKRAGDRVAAGERVGLIRFGSRVDVLFGPEWEILVEPGGRVRAGSSTLARRLEGAGSLRQRESETAHAQAQL